MVIGVQLANLGPKPAVGQQEPELKINDLIELFLKYQLTLRESNSTFKLIDKKIGSYEISNRKLTAKELTIYLITKSVLIDSSRKEFLEEELLPFLNATDQVKEAENEDLIPLYAQMSEMTLSHADAPERQINVHAHDVRWCLERIESNPRDTEALYFLAEMLASGESIQLLNGRKIDYRGILFEIIKAKPQDERAYIMLADSLYFGESIVMPNDEKWTRQDLFSKAINLNPSQSHAYSGLALFFSGSIVLPDGRKITDKFDLFLDAIQLSPKDALNYFRLGTYSSIDAIALRDGRKMNQTDLFLEAIHLNPKLSDAFCRLAEITEGVIKLKDGRKMDQRGLFFEALEGNPKCAEAYVGLSNLLKKGELIALKNGFKMDQKSLILAAIDFDPAHAKNYYSSLANLLERDETIKLPDGRIVDRRTLNDESS